MNELEKIKEIFLGQVYNMNQTVNFDREHAEWLIKRLEILEEDNERLTERVRQLESLLSDIKATLFNEIIEQEKILGSTPIEDEKLISHRKGIIGGLRISLSFLN